MRDFAQIGEAVRFAVGEEWCEAPTAEALYVSSGTDCKALTFTHPSFLARQLGREIEPPKFFVYVDNGVDPAESSLSFDDGRTEIRTVEQESCELHGFTAQLARVRMRSPELDSEKGAELRPGDLAVLRVRADNEEFAQAAIAEEWWPSYFIGVCDGCNYGGNSRCENQIHDPESSIPLRLKIPAWITDHLPGSTLKWADDPENGEEIQPAGEELPYSIHQAAFLNTKWRSSFFTRGRLRGGARLFTLRPKGKQSAGEFVHFDVLTSPRANRMLR